MTEMELIYEWQVRRDERLGIMLDSDKQATLEQIKIADKYAYEVVEELKSVDGIL